MTTDLNVLGEKVAKALGWTPMYDGVTRYWISRDGDPRLRPSESRECFKLCAEFNVWPVSIVRGNGTRKELRQHFMDITDHETGMSICVPHDNTPTGRLNAAIEVVLLAVLAIKEQS